ncbi:hypothetical protein L6164_023356 [Bauhinia variegata]|uniref:Uncharacterized protein n=1 Tax=Bauhinia variegata TaxID=167791 RepID=A0ACB9MJI0_BAUVA|nr:hypothetical protein L6164_023356 [Bauhinia variegata]
MSFPSLLFIVFFLCLSKYPCTAHHLVAVDETSNVQSNIHGKVAGNVKKHSIESSVEAEKEGIKSIGGAMTQRSKTTNAIDDIKKFKSSSEQEDLLGQAPAKSVVSVSWRVPHKKQDQNPGFYSDYSRPRTRPPSHN